MPKHTDKQVQAAMEVLRARLRKWDADRALEDALGRDIECDDIVADICVGLDDPEDVGEEEAIALLDLIAGDD